MSVWLGYVRVAKGCKEVGKEWHWLEVFVLRGVVKAVRCRRVK